MTKAIIIAPAISITGLGASRFGSALPMPSTIINAVSAAMTERTIRGKLGEEIEAITVTRSTAEWVEFMSRADDVHKAADARDPVTRAPASPPGSRIAGSRRKGDLRPVRDRARYP